MIVFTFAVALIAQVILCNGGHIPSPLTKQEGKHWALLVAGSYTYGNYRHQVYLRLQDVLIQ